MDMVFTRPCIACGPNAVHQCANTPSQDADNRKQTLHVHTAQGEWQILLQAIDALHHLVCFYGMTCFIMPSCTSMTSP